MTSLCRFAAIAMVGLVVLFPAVGDAAARDAVLPERSLGSPDAPVTMYEYSSLTCPHCAVFHAKTLPVLKKKYIDSGKLRLVLVDFPLDRLALAGALMARCAPEPVYYDLIDALFANQQTWTRAENPLEALKRMGRLAGLDDDALDACFADDAKFQAIRTAQANAQANYGVASTPSFVIGGTLYEGGHDAAYFARAIDALSLK